MARPLKGRQLLSKVKGFFAEAKKSASDFFHDVFKSPFSWRSVMWDSYLADELPEKTMRFTRIVTALGFILKFLNSAALGLFMIVDGIYSFYRNRFELKLTKSWHEDVPRFARIMLGMLIVANFWNF
ncbi:MAG: hypothetical protein QXF88_01745 [Candidatus Aenigmatarchaeota archaeon]